MCESFQELYTNLRGYNPNLKYEDAIVYTYAFIYQTVVDRYDQDVLSVCVDSDMQDDSDAYCE